MRGPDLGAGAEVSDRARDFEDAVVRAGRKAEALDGGDEETA